jgi:hypothetical protein
LYIHSDLFIPTPKHHTEGLRERESLYVPLAKESKHLYQRIYFSLLSMMELDLDLETPPKSEKKEREGRRD